VLLAAQMARHCLLAVPWEGAVRASIDVVPPILQQPSGADAVTLATCGGKRVVQEKASGQVLSQLTIGQPTSCPVS
jgi:hypothetical protein